MNGFFLKKRREKSAVYYRLFKHTFFPVIRILASQIIEILQINQEKVATFPKEEKREGNVSHRSEKIN